LKHGEDYVENYQILSEAPEGNSYRVVAQVTIALTRLREELEKVTPGHGVEAGPERPPAPESAAGASSHASTPASTPAPAPAPVPEKAVPELPRFKQKVLWLVPEKWGENWELPAGGEDGRSILAASALQEAKEFDIYMMLPEAGAVAANGGGKVSASEALALAGSTGAQAVAIGTAILDGAGGEKAMLRINVGVFNVATKLSLGEIHLERRLAGAPLDEREMEMGALVVPELARLLRESPRTSPAPSQPSPVAAPAPPSGESTDAGAVPGELTLVVRGYRHLSNWEELERVLRESFKSIAIKDVEIEPDAVRVRLDGVDPQFPGRLEGAKLPGGLQIHVSGYSAQDQTLNAEFVQSDGSS
jgi:hypothetical protein